MMLFFLIRHCELLKKARQSKAFLSDCFVMTLLAMTIALSPALAQDNATTDVINELKAAEKFEQEQKEFLKANEQTITSVEDTSYRFAPDTCDFEITFPEEPYTSRRCPEGTGKCYQLKGYTMVYDMRTTIDVSVTCVPSNPQSYERYTEPVMRAALKGMAPRAQIDSFDINFVDLETHRHASLNGQGGNGSQAKIYSAQLWSGQNSLMTVEAKLVGQSHPQADAVFSEILKSLHEKKAN
ncbi:MAG: hypothetical protein GW903_02340 [Alphaproteobacteria bacterium]|nr:hypothetical protein [Alphaproteobacteria bacterium]NCT05681.1 hypothetical protein [Alphaproteobacteria bacterium]